MSAVIVKAEPLKMSGSVPRNSPHKDREERARQVAESFGLHVITVYKWAAQGRIPSIKLSNGSLRFHPEHLQAFVSERTVGAA